VQEEENKGWTKNKGTCSCGCISRFA